MAPEIVSLLRQLFENNSNAYGIHEFGPNGKWRTERQPLTDALIQQHLAGQVGLGLHSTNPETGTCKWACFDVDAEGLSAERLVQQLHDVLFQQFQIPHDAIMHEFTGHYWHLWVFFQNPTPVAQVRRLGLAVLAQTGQRHLEFFPKQTQIGDLGNFVRLPLGVHPKTMQRSRCDLSSVVPCVCPDQLPSPEAPPTPAREQHERGPYKGSNPGCIQGLLEGVQEGERHEMALRLAGYLANVRQLRTETVTSTLEKWAKKCTPPFPTKELQQVIRDVDGQGYNYGCDDLILQSFCAKPEACRLRKWKGEQPPIQEKEAEPPKDPEAVEAATDILESPDPLIGVLQQLDHLIAGEEDNKAAIFINLLLGKTKDPEKVSFNLLGGEAGGGKTRLMMIADLFKVKDVGRFTEHALEYTDLTGYEVLRLKELGAMDQEKQGVSTLKFLSSDDQGFTVEYSIRDKDSGRMTTAIKHLPPICVITSTTRVTLDSQFERRSWLFNPDESEEQTVTIRDFIEQQQLEKNEVLLGLRSETSLRRSRRILRALVQRIQPCRVVIPFPKALLETLKTERLRVRGDYSKLLNTIEAAALLYWRQLPALPDTDIVFATPRLVALMLKRFYASLVSMTVELDKRTQALLETLKKLPVDVKVRDDEGKDRLIERSMGEEGLEIGKDERKTIAKAIHKDDRTVRRYLDELVDSGYAMKQGGRGKPVVHELLYSADHILAGALTWTPADLDKTPVQVPFLLRMAQEGVATLQGYLDKLGLPVDVQQRIMQQYRAACPGVSNCPEPPQTPPQGQEKPNGTWTGSLSKLGFVQAEHGEVGQKQSVQPERNVSNCPTGKGSRGTPTEGGEGRTGSLSKSEQVTLTFGPGCKEVTPEASSGTTRRQEVRPRHE